MNEEVQGEWVLVPGEPTEEMSTAGAHASSATQDEVRPSTAAAIYRAMLAASPSPSQQERGLKVSDKAVEAAARAVCEDEWGPNSWLLVSAYSRIKAENHARAALLAASSVSPATGFEVNNLQWQLTGPPGSDIEAATALGTYTINRDELSAGGAYNLWLAGETNDDIFAPYDSLAEAKAAAQSNFDRRVRSCLAPQPSSADSEATP